MNHAARSTQIAAIVAEFSELHLAQVRDLQEFVSAFEQGDGTVHLERAIRSRETRCEVLYRELEGIAFSPSVQSG